MIAKCDNCGTEFARYDDLDSPCHKCGSFIVWCLHPGFGGEQDEWCKIDLRKPTEKLAVVKAPRPVVKIISPPFDPRQAGG